MRRHPWWTLGLLCLSFAATAACAEAAVEVRRPVLAGGAVGGAATQHALGSTLGQSVAGRTLAATHAIAAGFWHPRPGPSQVPDLRIPDRFRLHAAVPNPFSTGTSFRYDVPQSAGRVQLRIYDVNGRVARTLLEGESAPGQNRVDWDGRDDRGNIVPLGLYLCTFDAPGYRQSIKLVRLR